MATAEQAAVEAAQRGLLKLKLNLLTAQVEKASKGGFNEDQHPRDEKGRWTEVGAVEALKKANPALKHFSYKKPGRGDHDKESHWLLASTETTKPGSKVPATLPGHKTATGIALRVNPEAKHIHFSELNSHIKGAGRAMVEAILKKYPDYKYSVVDLSGIGKSGQTFWAKIRSKYGKNFTSS